jgi:methanogenic corrinoid protein MtbC1
MTVTGTGDLASARQRFLAALGDVDRDAALRVVADLLDAGVPPRQVLAELVAESQRTVGELWQCGDWNVAQEHAATAISEAAVALVAARRRPREDGVPSSGRVAVACVDGEWHALPARLVAETLADLGWDVTYLGASVPASHLAQFLHDTGPDVVALSCSLPSNLPAARDVIVAARSAGVPVVVGGRGFGPDDTRARALGADGWAPDPVAASELVARWEPALSSPPASGHPAGVEADRLVSRLSGLVDEIAAELDELPGLRAASRRGALDPEVDLEHLLRALAAGMLLPDPTIVTESVSWWTTVLVARGVPAEAAARVAGIAADVLDRSGLEVAAAALRAA